MNILSNKLSDTGYGSILQSAKGGAQLLSSEHITQDFGMPGDLGLWEPHAGRMGGFASTQLYGGSGENEDRN